MKFLGDYLLQVAGEYPDRIAVVQDEHSLTYKELNTECNRLANALKELGISKGDCIAVMTKSGIEWLLILYACQKLGVGVVLVHSRLLPEEIQRTIQLAGAETLIYSTDYLDKVDYISTNSKSIRRYIGVGFGSDTDPLPAGHYDFGQLMLRENVTETQTELDGSEKSVILFTSGTTSASKGIVRTQEMMGAYASLFVNDEFLKNHEVMLTPSPLYHAAGLCCVIKMLVNAGTLVLLSSFNCEKVCSQIQQFRATQIALVPPTSYQRLRLSGYPEKYDLSSVKLTHIAAGKASKECIEDIFHMFPNTKLRFSWGSTEVSNVTCSILSQEQLRQNPKLMETIGKLNPVSQLMLIDNDGRVVEGAGDGEAYVRSPLILKEYIKAPELTEKCFSQGWFKTEDILHRDSEGYYYLLDRKRDIIKTGGENVYAQEIEQTILNCPAVAECAVVGVPDAKFGEAIAAALVLKNNCHISSDEFIHFCRSVLPSFKKPKYWVIMDSLPKNDIGKVRKSVLKDRAAELFSPIA